MFWNVSLKVEAEDRKGPKKGKSKPPRDSAAATSPKKASRQRRHSASSNNSGSSELLSQQSPRSKSQSPTRFKSSSSTGNLEGMAGQGRGKGQWRPSQKWLFW